MLMLCVSITRRAHVTLLRNANSTATSISLELVSCVSPNQTCLPWICEDSQSRSTAQISIQSIWLQYSVQGSRGSWKFDERRVPPVMLACAAREQCWLLAYAEQVYTYVEVLWTQKGTLTRESVELCHKCSRLGFSQKESTRLVGSSVFWILNQQKHQARTNTIFRTALRRKRWCTYDSFSLGVLVYTSKSSALCGVC